MRRTGVTGALVLLLVAGCTSSGGSDPSSSAPPSTPPISSAPVTSSTPTTATSSPTPSTSIPTTGPNVRPGETVPMRPAAANLNTSIGAIALSSFWFRALDWGYATTSSALPRTIYTARCTDCAAFMDDYDEVRRAGQHYVGGRIEIISFSNIVGDHRFGGQRVTEVTVRTATLKTVNASGHVLTTSAAIPRASFLVYMRWTDGRGSVVAFKEVRK